MQALPGPDMSRPIKESSQQLNIDQKTIVNQREIDCKKMDELVFIEACNAFHNSVVKERDVDDHYFGIYKVISVLDVISLSQGTGCASTPNVSNSSRTRAVCNGEYAGNTSPLKWSMLKNKKIEIAEVLLQCGADPNKLDKNNKTVLDYVLASGLTDMRARMNLLLKYGARPSSYNTVDQLQNIGVLQKIKLPNQN